MSWQIMLVLLVAIPVVVFSLGLIWYLNARHKSSAAKTQAVLQATDETTGKTGL